MFENKVVWITGASSGIGEALAIEVARKGAKVVLSARREDKLEEVRNKLTDPDKHLVLPMDLTETSKFDKMVVQVIEHYGHIHFLFNNAGVSQRSSIHDTPVEVDRKIMEINYFGNIALTKAVLPVFRAQKEGHVLVASSIMGKFGFYLRSAYAASKHALHGFYESLMLEEEGKGLRVTIACPGRVNTEISFNAITADGSPYGHDDHKGEKGLSPQECAKIMIKAVEENQFEVLVGNKETRAVTLRRFSPALFWKVIRNRGPK